MPTKYNVDSYIDDQDTDDAVWQLLNLYADDEASPEEVAKVEELLRSDNSYREYLNFLRSTSIVVREWDEVAPPVTLRDSILAATLHRPTFRTRLASLVSASMYRVTGPLAFPAAGLVAAGVLGLLFVHHTNIGPKTNLKDSSGQHFASTVKPVVPSNPYGVTGSSTNPELVVHSIRSRTPPRLKSQHLDATMGQLMFAKNMEHRDRPGGVSGTGGLRDAATGHSDELNSVVVSPAVYRPNMDAQNERPTVAAPMPVADSSEPEITVPSGSDQEIAAADSGASKASAGSVGSEHSDVSSAPRPKTIVAHLSAATALPPDPTQVLTRADMARNRAAMNSGYDRTTLRSLERKEASISLIRGTF